MNTHPNDPLTTEERELARLMARLGPTGEPSPSLDAKILAAAHSAVAREPARARKPRWPVAMGLAASVVFAVGIAWQLRPVQQVATMQEAAIADAAMEAAPADAPASAAAAPVVAEVVAQDAVSEPPPPPMQAMVPPPPPSKTVMEPAPAAQKPTPSIPPKPAAVERRAARSPSGYVASPPPPPAAPPVPAPEAPPVVASEPQAFASDREAGALGADAAPAETSARSARDMSARQSATRVEMKAANAAAVREEEGATLDRIEVTGTRLRTDRQVPISDDARLAVDDWLERVRTRYGLGDAEAARQSLLLFVKDHPDETVPDDLDPLLDE